MLLQLYALHGVANFPVSVLYSQVFFLVSGFLHIALLLLMLTEKKQSVSYFNTIDKI